MLTPVKAATSPGFPSLKWWWAIRDHEDLSPSLRFVAMVIGAFANETGEVRPSLDRLKANTGLSHSQIKRLREQLRRLGYLQIVMKGVGRGQASVYRLTFPQQKQLTEPPVKQLMQTSLHPQENGSSNELLRETGSDTYLPKEEVEGYEDLLVSPLGDYGEFPTTSIEDQLVTPKELPWSFPPSSSLEDQPTTPKNPPVAIQEPPAVKPKVTAIPVEGGWIIRETKLRLGLAKHLSARRRNRRDHAAFDSSPGRRPKRRRCVATDATAAARWRRDPGSRR